MFFQENAGDEKDAYRYCVDYRKRKKTAWQAIESVNYNPKNDYFVEIFKYKHTHDGSG